MRRSVEIDRKNIELTLNYTYRQRRRAARTGRLRARLPSVKIGTWDVTSPEGSPYRRLVARNDQPLSARGAEGEEEKLRKSIEDRRQETPEQRQRRIADWERRRESQRESLRENSGCLRLPAGGEESLNGGHAYVIDATPKPGYKPKSPSAFFLPQVKARFWIDKTDYHWIKVAVETLDTISFAGFLVRLAPGSVATIEQAQVNQEVWLPKSMRCRWRRGWRWSRRAAGDVITTFSDYKKFQADSRVVEISEPRQP